MHRQLYFKLLATLGISAGAIMLIMALRGNQATVAAQESETPGTLQVLDSTGKPKAKCPLKQTTVKAEISGFLSRVVVTQEFENPFKEKIEAVYTFPLPQNAAVDDMTMLVGDRTVRGKILRREEAEAVYEAAKSGGQVASLLNQERPNIFTQSVANIEPGKRIDVNVKYFHTLEYADGAYELSFPMVVGPRFNPPGFAEGIGAVPRDARGAPHSLPDNRSVRRPPRTPRHRARAA